MRHMTRAITRLSTVGLASLLALAVSVANAQETAAAIIGKVN